jgi:hypothetical protein
MFDGGGWASLDPTVAVTKTSINGGAVISHWQMKIVKHVGRTPEVATYGFGSTMRGLRA